MTFNIDKIVNHLGKGSIIVIVITFILFTVALFVKGFTHDLLIEIAVFLVSVKLILITYTSSVTARKLETNLNDLNHKIDRLLEKEHN